MAAAALTLTPYPVGTDVSVYLAAQRLVSAPPSGSAITDAVVDSLNGLAFTGLADDTQYVAYALVGGSHMYVGFRTAPAAADGGGGGVEADDDSAYAELAGADFEGNVSVSGTGYISLADWGVLDVRSAAPDYLFSTGLWEDDYESLRIHSNGNVDWIDPATQAQRAQLGADADGLRLRIGNLRFGEGQGPILEDTATSSRYRVAVTNGALTLVGPL